MEASTSFNGITGFSKFNPTSFTPSNLFNLLATSAVNLFPLLLKFLKTPKLLARIAVEVLPVAKGGTFSVISKPRRGLVSLVMNSQGEEILTAAFFNTFCKILYE